MWKTYYKLLIISKLKKLNMKKINKLLCILITITLMACESQMVDEPVIIKSIYSYNEGYKYKYKYKAIVKQPNIIGFTIYSDNKYSIGDTIKLCK